MDKITPKTYVLHPS